ncbi:MAG TPA: GNAT family N-acetyltransferase [Flavobacteriales bacterium]|nr:GNAT family N-acetyltransferase [Flavobacteriales bacterium]
MQLIQATGSNAPLIREMAETIWWSHYPAIIGDEQVKFMLGKMYSLESLHSQIEEGKQLYYILVEDENPIGFIGIEPLDSTCAFIHKFYLLQTKQRKGSGTSAFQLVLNQFPEVKEIRLQVNRQNYQAINFYFKIGFIIEKVADFDIGDGYFMNDFIMKWNKI